MLPKADQIALGANGVVLVPEENDLFIGWKPTLNFQFMKEPKFTWKRSKIPFELWEQVVCFLRWSQRKYRDEAMVTFFYNTTEDKWAVEVFPQRGRGMTVDLLENDPEYATLRAKYGAGWVQMGSVHHHCTMKAFMSGTDEADERDRDGVHITLGEMTDPEVDTHIRVSFNGTLFNSTLFNWIELPEWVHMLPDYMLDFMDLENLVFALPDNVSFPDEWKPRCRQSVVTYGHGQHAMDHGHGGVYDHHWDEIARAHEEKKQAGTTVLTKSETNGVQNTPSSTELATQHSLALQRSANENLDQKMMGVISDLCVELSLTIPGMRALLACDETDQKLMREINDPDWHILCQLKASLTARNISPLYVEAMLDRIL